MKLVRVLLAALATLAIGVGVQVATSPDASAACTSCWAVIGEG